MKALIFDLDGTLVDSVYAHVLAWQLAFAEAGIPIDGWRLHRRMGMSDGLFKRAVMRELGRTISMPRLKALDKHHGELFRQFLPKPRPLPGAVELLRFLRRNKIVHGIATSNQRPNINHSLKTLGVTKDTVVVERGDVARAKPEPDLFLECQERLGVEVKDCYVVGDAVWDLLAARRAGMLSIGLLSGGYGEDELTRAGTFRVFRDAADLHSCPKRGWRLGGVGTFGFVACVQEVAGTHVASLMQRHSRKGPSSEETDSAEKPQATF